MQLFKKLLNPLISCAPVLIGFILWETFAASTSTNFPPPSLWLASILKLNKNHQFYSALLETLWTFGIGLFIASFLGFVIGLLIGTSHTFKIWIAYVLEFFRCLPPPVIIPIAVLILGYSPTMKITVIVIASIWPILLNVVSAINQLGNGLFEMGKTLHLNRVDILRKLLIPAILPGFLIGIRVAAPLAVIITLLIEMLTAMPGLGGLMIAGQRNFNASQVFGILIVVGIVGLAVNQLSLFLEKILLAYKPPKTQR